ncbi:MAG: PBP1A family penicillin-binding protein [Candidatus Yanofskybacteria bacterium]|nr:PBP1A family penicillin-binding protein [Candidatus Yanofskybacteria bacterium]
MFKSFLLTFFLLLVIGLVLAAALFLYVAKDLPGPETIISRRVSESTKIYDRTGNTVLYDIHGEEKRTIVPWEKMPENIKLATLASEDSSFYSHQGLDFKGIIRAFIRNISEFRISQGGSTITQQLIKNALLGDQRQNFFSVTSRKIKEALLSIEIERKFSKDQIFWMYLNQIPYGSNSYGIEAASQTFFGKQADSLSLAEAALLAALPKAPSYYSPYGERLDEALKRKNSILEKMFLLDYIDENQYNTAINEKLSFKPSRENIIAPHFVILVKDYLIKKYGEEMAENGGLKIFTTLDYDLQKIAEQAINSHAEKNEKQYKAKNAALTAINPRTGQILAMVGSRDYFDLANEGNFNVATARRQPGSSFKPFAYAVAMEKGYTDSTILFDFKTEFNPQCLADSSQEKDSFGLDCYHPQNYDGRFRGPVTMRQALAQSLNVPSVKTLYLAGVDDTINFAQRMGISTLEENRKNFGLSLVLGGAEVKLIDMVSAYGAFANDGIRQSPASILKIEDSEGNVLEEYKPKEERAVEPQIARTITSILSDNSSRTAVFGANSSLYFPDRPVAAKTGTTQENRDAWVLGYTPSLSVGVWVGNNDNTSMTRQGAGISASGPIWHEFLAAALKESTPEEFIQPDPVEVDKIMLNGSYLPANPEDSKEIHSILYYLKKDDPRGDSPSDPFQDSQFKNWEEIVRINFNLTGN